MKNLVFEELEDSALVTLLQQSNERAFTEIYRRYHGNLYLHALKMLGGREEARDVVQELFARLWNARERFSLTTSLSSYLYTAVRNRILDIFSHEKIVNRYRQSFQEFTEQGDFITDNMVREKELAILIEQEIAGLPEKMREVFEMSRKGHLSHIEIAQELQLSEHTVKKQISKAIKRLRAKLDLLITGFYILLEFFF